MSENLREGLGACIVHRMKNGTHPKNGLAELAQVIQTMPMITPAIVEAVQNGSMTLKELGQHLADNGARVRCEA